MEHVRTWHTAPSSWVRTGALYVAIVALVGACSTPAEPAPLLQEPVASATEERIRPTEPATTVPPTVQPATEVPATVMPPTDVPTAIPLPPTSPPPTNPPAVPTDLPPPPTEPPAPRPDYSDPAADRNCSDFADGWEAQAWWDYWRARGSNNPGGLDGDGDGDVCESRK